MTILNELRGNQRLRLGLSLIAAIFLAYGLLEWRDQQELDTASYRRALSQLARLASIKDEQRWHDRVEEAKQARDLGRALLWTASSTGRAQAEAQDWLNTVLRQADAKAFTLRVAEGDVALDASGVAAKLPVSLGGLTPLRARVEFNTEAPVLLAILAALNDSERRIIVEGLTVKPHKTELTLSFWFLIKDKAPPSDAATLPDQGGGG